MSLTRILDRYLRRLPCPCGAVGPHRHFVVRFGAWEARCEVCRAHARLVDAAQHAVNDGSDRLQSIHAHPSN